MSGDIPCATSDAQSMQTTSGPMATTKQPGMKLTRTAVSISHTFYGYLNFLNEKCLFITVPMSLRSYKELKILQFLEICTRENFLYKSCGLLISQNTSTVCD